MRPALVITADAPLSDSLLRLTAAAGVAVDVFADPEAALRLWAAAPLVLLGPDAAQALACRRPPRRPGVVLVARALTDEHFRLAVEVGASDVVDAEAAQSWLVEALADIGDGGVRTGPILGFVGGSGGVGATTLACATAAAGADLLRAALLDVDRLGPGVERVLGMDDEPGVRWADLSGSVGRLGARALRDSLPQLGRLRVLGWGTAAGVAADEQTVADVIDAAARGHDLVVLDLPRHLDAAATVAVARCDQVVLVAGCSLPGAAAAARVARTVSAVAGSVGLVTRTRPGGVAPDQLALALDLPLLASVPEQRRLAEQLDLGLGPLHARRGPVARTARTLVELVVRRQEAVA